MSFAEFGLTSGRLGRENSRAVGWTRTAPPPGTAGEVAVSEARPPSSETPSAGVAMSGRRMRASLIMVVILGCILGDDAGVVRRERRQLREPSRNLASAGEQLVGRHDFVDGPPILRGLGIELLPGQNEVTAAHATHQWDGFVQLGVSKDGDEHARTPIISTVLAFRFQLDLSPVMKS